MVHGLDSTVPETRINYEGLFYRKMHKSTSLACREYADQSIPEKN
jgi:hypothetical protein